MSKLLPYWGHIAQPSSTYYLQKVSYDIYGIVDHRDGTGNLYPLNEMAQKIQITAFPTSCITLNLLVEFRLGFEGCMSLWTMQAQQIKINL